MKDPNHNGFGKGERSLQGVQTQGGCQSRCSNSGRMSVKVFRKMDGASLLGAETDEGSKSL